MNNLLNLLGKIKDPNTNWKYILIVVILVFIAGGIIGFQWWLVKEETKIPEVKIPEKQNIIKPEREKSEEIISDDRILIDQTLWENDEFRCEKFGEERKIYNDQPSITIEYQNPTKGISMKIPYNPAWGTEKYRIPPYYEYEKGVEFGPLIIFERGCYYREYYMLFLPARNIEETITALQTGSIALQTGYEGGILKDTIIRDRINEVAIVRYNLYDTLRGETPSIEVIGKKFNYRFTCVNCSPEEGFKTLEKLIKTIQFIE